MVFFDEELVDRFIDFFYFLWTFFSKGSAGIQAVILEVVLESSIFVSFLTFQCFISFLPAWLKCS